MIVSLGFSQGLITPNQASEVTSFNPSTTVEIPTPTKTPDFSSQGTKGLLYENGPLVTHPNCLGVSGADYSYLESPLTSYGAGYQISYNNMMCDEFTCAVDWNVDSVVFFGYQSFTATSPSTFLVHHFMILDGHPDSSATTVVFGDTLTNALINTYWSGIYRGNDTTNTDRPIMRNVCNASGCVLTAGTYYLVWRADGSSSSGPWAPPITILGTPITGNALQYTTTWAALVDGTTGDAQGMPFEIHGSINSSIDDNRENNLEVYPNPTNGILNINNAKETTVYIYNIIGELVHTSYVSTDVYQINMEKLSNGTYILKTIKGNDVQARKFNIVK